jgi:large subunit ribosomal protein L23
MNQERIYKVLEAPHISEKATVVADSSGQVVFRVITGATKPEIKQAVEQLFEVKVIAVRVLNAKGKTRRNRFGIGRCNNIRKAYVRLAAGQEIDFTSEVGR